jgi:hypothetical protein
MSLTVATDSSPRALFPVVSSNKDGVIYKLTGKHDGFSGGDRLRLLSAGRIQFK